MANLKHLFKVNQEVRIKNDDFDSLNKWDDGVVTKVHEDHIIVHLTEIGINGYYKEGFNLDCVYPKYNF